MLDREPKRGRITKQRVYATLGAVALAIRLSACGAPGEWNNHYDPQHPGGDKPVPTLAPENFEFHLGGDPEQDRRNIGAAYGTDNNPIIEDINGGDAECQINADGTMTDLNPNDSNPCQ